MPKAKAKKKTDFQNRMTRSFFFYGKPNTGKLSLLNQMQTTYTDLVNRNIQLLAGRHDLLLQLVKNDKKDSDMRKLEKSVRERQSTGMVANLQFCHDFPEIIKHFRRTKS